MYKDWIPYLKRVIIRYNRGVEYNIYYGSAATCPLCHRARNIAKRYAIKNKCEHCIYGEMIATKGNTVFCVDFPYYVMGYSYKFDDDKFENMEKRIRVIKYIIQAIRKYDNIDDIKAYIMEKINKNLDAYFVL